LDGIRIFKMNQRDNSKLKFFEGFNSIGFYPKRIFYILGDKNEARGNHAHKEQTQFMVCLQGKMEISCDDGENKSTYILNKDNAIMVNPLIWSEQIYLEHGSLLLVLADGPYSENEYLRNYADFMRYIKK